MEIKPFRSNILIKPVAKKQILVNENQSLCEYGEVVAVGCDVGDDIKVGDLIGFTIWGVNKLQINDETHYFIPYDPRFVLGTIRM